MVSVVSLPTLSQSACNYKYKETADQNIENGSIATWSNLPAEIRLSILRLCSIKIWTNMMLLDKASFSLVNTIVYDLFKMAPNKLEKTSKELYPLLFSKEAKKAIKTDSVYQKYISSPCLDKIKHLDYVKIGKLILFRNKMFIFKNKSGCLPLKDLPSIGLGDAPTLPNIFSDTAAADESIFSNNMTGLKYVSKEWTHFIIKNLPILHTQEQKPTIAPIIDIPPEDICFDITEACENYLFSRRHNFPPTHIQKNRNIVLKMLESNMFVDDSLYEEKQHPILWAISKNRMNFLKLFIEKGFNIHAKNKEGTTGLHIAAAKNKLPIIEVLVQGFVSEKTGIEIKIQSDINALDTKHNTPLHHASQHGHLEVVRYLHENGADIHAKDINKNTALHYAAIYGHIEVVRYMLENKGDIEAKDIYKTTALHYAALQGHIEVVRYLHENGADIQAKDIDNNTALHHAAMQGHTDIVEYLLENNVDIYAENNYTHTALYEAARNENFNIIILFFKKGMNVELLPTQIQIQLLRKAVMKDNKDIISYLHHRVEEMLEDKHLNIIRSQKNRAFLKMSKEKGYQQVTKSLQRNIKSQFPIGFRWLGKSLGHFLTRCTI